MGWMLRVLRHRAGAQQTILATVLTVTMLGTTLLGSFALLLSTSEHHALDAALSRAPARDTEVALTLALGTRPAAPAVEAADAYLDELLGPVDDSRTLWLTSALYTVPDTGDGVEPLVYLSSTPLLPDAATLVDGAWPETAPAEGEPIPVAVPEPVVERYGWEVGDVVTVRSTADYGDEAIEVVGVYQPDPPRSAWTRDLLDGRLHDPTYPRPGSFGSVKTDAWGPFAVAPGTFTGSTGDVATVQVVATPDLSSLTPEQLDALRDRLATAQEDAAGRLGDLSATTTVGTALGRTIQTATSDLAITGVVLVIVGLMLVVVAVTVLLLAARLLAERRAAEQTLMGSRGASSGQLLGLAGLEALAVAGVTALVAPWLARALYGAVTLAPVLEDAGLHVDPGLPASLWITCGVTATLLAAVLLGPMLRRRASVTDSEQQLVRQDRRQGLARSGVDLALLVVAGVALWQLHDYRSPVLAGSGARIDPVLVAAPALVLLAGSVLAIRLVPLLSGAGEVVARRSRSLVGPVAAWEVSRRPARAAGAVLLLTLAVAVGSFAQGYLSTWRTSQQDQVDLEVGTDLRVSGVDGTALEQGTALGEVDAVQAASAVTFTEVGVGLASDPVTEARAHGTQLLAIDTTHAAELLRGRVDGGWAQTVAPLVPSTPVTGIPVPAGTDHLLVDLAGTVDLPMPGSVRPTLVLQDGLGSRTGIALPRLGGEPMTDVRVDLPAGARDVQVVGLVVTVGADVPVGPSDIELMGDEPVAYGLTLTDLRAVAGPADETADGEADEAPAGVTSLALDSAHWGAREVGDQFGLVGPLTLDTSADAITIAGSAHPMRFSSGVATHALATFAERVPVPAVITPEVLSDLGTELGTDLAIDVAGVVVPVRPVAVVPYLPGLPEGSGMLLDRDLLTRYTLMNGATGSFVDEWWAQVPDEQAAAAVADAAALGLGELRSRELERTVATDGPLRVGVQAALWTVTLAAVLLAVAGFAMSATVAVRSRRLELARLQALGTSRDSLVRAVLLEYALLGVVGFGSGLAIGALLASVIGPLVTVSPGGGVPIPVVLVQWPWPAQVALVGGTAALAALAVVLTAQSLLRRASGELLRLGDEG